MVDVFISYPQRERALMLPIKQRLEALGLILFVDVDGRLDGEATFPEALDKGVRASKAVLGCWSPWALGRPWVQTECAIGKDENKLVAVERVTLTAADVPALFYLVDRKPLSDFDGTAPHEGWAMTLSALATKLKLWVEKRPDHPEATAVREKIVVLEKAAAAERAALDQPQPKRETGAAPRPAVASDAAERAWAAIERSLDVSHYRRFERTFESDPAAFVRVIEAEARAKALERWAATDQRDAHAIAETLRTGLFPALQEVAERALVAAETAARERAEAKARAEAEEQTRQEQLARERARERAEAEAHEQARIAQERAEAAARERAEAERLARERVEAERRVAPWRAEGRIPVDAKIVHGDGEAAKAGWLKPGAGNTEWFKDVDIGPEMVVVPADSFTMGSPAGEPERTSDFEAQVPVTIARPFAVGRCAVTRGEFAAFVHATGYTCENGAYGWTGSTWQQDAKYSWRNPGFPQDDRHPVVCVDWDDALAYVTWLSEVTRQPYRLLSEAEWEYAARAGTTTPFWWGASISTAQANYDGNYTYAGGAKGIRRKGTLPVDYQREQFGANPWGLHQVHGNVWEWCADCWNAKHKGNPGDGAARTIGECSVHVIRGGSWYLNPRSLRAANRFWYNDRSGLCGFRVGRCVVPPRTL